MRVILQALRGVCAVVLLLAAMPVAALVCYVSPNFSPAGGGLSWSAPWPLQNALEEPQCTEIWAARGIYRTGPAGSPQFAFVIRRNVKLYGGFLGTPGTEGDFSQRDPARYLSVLSGDIDANDTVDANGIPARYTDRSGVNARHVVVLQGDGVAIDARTVIDGFSIVGGQAGGDIAFDKIGGGLFCNGSVAGAECSPVLSNLLFQANSASYGGALYLHAGSAGRSQPMLRNVTFISNAGSLHGGAIYSEGANAGPKLSNATFHANLSVREGTALYTNGGHAELVNVTVNDFGLSKAVYNQGGSLTIRNSLLWSILAGDGEAEVWLDGASATISDSLLRTSCLSWPNSTANCTGITTGDPMLSMPAWRGGKTPTVLPQSGSAAIDAGNDAVCAASPIDGRDQRGVVRPRGTHCDLGATEVQLAALTVTVTGPAGSKVDNIGLLPQTGAIANCTPGASSGCAATFAGEPAVAKLRANVPAGGYVVTWGGACSGYQIDATVALTAATQQCTATIARPSVLTVQTANEPASATSQNCSAPGIDRTCQTLRDAINAASSGDVIRFAAALDGATITLTAASNPLGCAAMGPNQCAGGGTPGRQFGPSAFFVSGRQLVIDAATGMTQGVTLARDGAASAFRLFDIDAQAGLELRGLVLRNGLARGGSAGRNGGGALGAGGAIFNRGRLVLDRCTFADNRAVGGDYLPTSTAHGAGGAGVGQDSPGAALAGGGPNGGHYDAQFGAAYSGGFGGGGAFAVVPENTSYGGDGGFGGGGGFASAGSFQVGYGGDGGFGGGAGAGSNGLDTVVNGQPGFGGGRTIYTLDGNCCGGAGAGMGGAVFNDAGTVTVTNATFFGNTATGGSNIAGVRYGASGYGGAIFNYAGNVTLRFATLAGNTVEAAVNANSLAARDGGAIYSLGDSAAACAAGGNTCTTNGAATLTLENSIAANSAGGSDVIVHAINGGASTSAGAGNVVMSAQGLDAEITNGANPQPGALLPGGGLVSVMPLPAGSAAIDAAANCGGANGIDQTGLARPQGDGCDAGAAERDFERLFADGFEAGQ